LREYAKVDYGVVRGLAYYTGVVFEAFDRHGEFRAIAGGGRYDDLVKLISNGKVNLPALGFGMGDVVLLELLKALGRLPKFDTGLDAFCLIEDQALRGASLKLIEELRCAGLAVDYSLTPAKSDKQFKRAQELKAACALRLDRTAGGELLAWIKGLRTREEKRVAPAQAAAQVRAFAGC
jgi:histidyl-tRNA synthetase